MLCVTPKRRRRRTLLALRRIMRQISTSDLRSALAFHRKSNAGKHPGKRRRCVVSPPPAVDVLPTPCSGDVPDVARDSGGSAMGPPGVVLPLLWHPQSAW